jgi:uncharacterized protein
VVGPGGFLGTQQYESLDPFLFLAMYSGPTLGALLMIALVDGRAGFRELRARLFRWRVGGRWYAVALLTAPVPILALLLPISLVSPGFLPGLFASGDKASLLLLGVTAGLATGLCEELGWTGFALPRMRRRFSVLVSGAIMGLLWGAWHFPLFSSGDPSSAVPRMLVVAGLLFTVLPAFRVLMVWVYEWTESLFVAVLMHASLTASTLIFQPAEVAGGRALAYNLVLTAALWTIVGLVAVGRRRATGRDVLARSAGAPKERST